MREIMDVTEEADTQAATGYLVPTGTEVEVPGSGAVYELGSLAGRPILLALRVDEALEQESLHISIWASADGQNWGETPLVWFPQIFYAGLKPAALNLSERPEIKFLQARWDVKRWGRGSPRPYFKFSLEIQPLNPQPPA
jgi:hypothetical protein